MIKALLSGCCGRMGTVVAKLSEQFGVEIVAGYDIAKKECAFPVYDDILQVKEIPQVIIDFSNPATLSPILKFAVQNNIPVIIATTGYDSDQLAYINSASCAIPVFMSANMSLGINLIAQLAKKAAEITGDSFDIEIIEKHHNQKIDAPSGTAIMLADEISKALPYESKQVHDRQKLREKRKKQEIGMHAVRGGTIVGEHEIIFAGTDEIISISHVAMSRDILATGALKAAAYIIDKKHGMYNMTDLVLAK